MSSGPPTDRNLAFVVIGRNEGARLARCLDSVRASVQDAPIVYVDSGSTDDSRDLARARGATVVDLDTGIPFSAARARNAGADALPAPSGGNRSLVCFLDGDVQLVEGFVEQAVARFADPTIVAVCGYRREIAPDRNIYHRMCDVEWRIGPVGDCPAFGGDVVLDLAALRAAGGYDPAVIAGEEGELCVRLRANGGRIVRIDATSTLHDVGIDSWRAWWRRY